MSNLADNFYPCILLSLVKISYLGFFLIFSKCVEIFEILDLVNSDNARSFLLGSRVFFIFLETRWKFQMKLENRYKFIKNFKIL